MTFIRFLPNDIPMPDAGPEPDGEIALDWMESRTRVIALIDSLRLHDPAAFADDKVGDNTAIANAFIVVDGEPMTGVRDEEAIV